MRSSYRYWSSSLCSLLHSPGIWPHLGPNILFSTLFWNTLSPRSSLSASDQVSHKIRGEIIVLYILVCRSQWPRCLRCRSMAARLLKSWVRIPPRACMSVCCECCVLSGRGLCKELITRPEESYRKWCGVCDLGKNKPREWGRSRPTRGLSRQEKEILVFIFLHSNLEDKKFCTDLEQVFHDLSALNFFLNGNLIRQRCSKYLNCSNLLSLYCDFVLHSYLQNGNVFSSLSIYFYSSPHTSDYWSFSVFLSRVYAPAQYMTSA